MADYNGMFSGSGVYPDSRRDGSGAVRPSAEHRITENKNGDIDSLINEILSGDPAAQRAAAFDPVAASRKAPFVPTPTMDIVSAMSSRAHRTDDGPERAKPSSETAAKEASPQKSLSDELAKDLSMSIDDLLKELDAVSSESPVASEASSTEQPKPSAYSEKPLAAKPASPAYSEEPSTAQPKPPVEPASALGAEDDDFLRSMLESLADIDALISESSPHGPSRVAPSGPSDADVKTAPDLSSSGAAGVKAAPSDASKAIKVTSAVFGDEAAGFLEPSGAADKERNAGTKEPSLNGKAPITDKKPAGEPQAAEFEAAFDPIDLSPKASKTAPDSETGRDGSNRTLSSQTSQAMRPDKEPASDLDMSGRETSALDSRPSSRPSESGSFDPQPIRPASNLGTPGRETPALDGRPSSQLSESGSFDPQPIRPASNLGTPGRETPVLDGRPSSQLPESSSFDPQPVGGAARQSGVKTDDRSAQTADSMFAPVPVTPFSPFDESPSGKEKGSNGVGADAARHTASGRAPPDTG